MKKYLLLAILCAFWPSTLLLGCTGATGPGNFTGTTPHTGNNISGFTGTCIAIGTATNQSPIISTTTLNSDNTVTIEWQWYQATPIFIPSIVIEYSLDSGVNWNYLANNEITSGNPVTSYTSSVLQPGTYTFKVGSYSYNTPTTAYFSNPSAAITIGTTTPPSITINGAFKQGCVYAAFNGTFSGNPDTIVIEITQKVNKGNPTTESYTKAKNNLIIDNKDNENTWSINRSQQIDETSYIIKAQIGISPNVTSSSMTIKAIECSSLGSFYCYS